MSLPGGGVQRMIRDKYTRLENVTLLSEPGTWVAAATFKMALTVLIVLVMLTLGLRVLFSLLLLVVMVILLSSNTLYDLHLCTKHFLGACPSGHRTPPADGRAFWGALGGVLLCTSYLLNISRHNVVLLLVAPADGLRLAAAVWLGGADDVRGGSLTGAAEHSNTQQGHQTQSKQDQAAVPHHG